MENTMTKTKRRLTGMDAIRSAETLGADLHKYADPTEGAREVSTCEAREIAQVDPELIYIDVDE